MRLEVGFFDIDQTLINREGVLYGGLEQILPHVRKTYLTGRPHWSLRQLMADNHALSGVGPGLLVAVENGGRIMDSALEKNIFYQPLSATALTGLAAYVSTIRDVEYVAFQPEDPISRPCVWLPHNTKPENAPPWAQDSRILAGSPEHLEQTLASEQPCMVTVRAFSKLTHEPPQPMSHHTWDRITHIVPNATDKGRAALTMANYCGLTPSQLLIAGNDSNDIPMLNIPDLGAAVLVGNALPQPARQALAPHIEHVPDETQLCGLIGSRLVRQC